MLQEKRVLYTGLDESNHGKEPEICVAIFSTKQEDLAYRQFQLRNREFRKLQSLSSPYRDFRFLILNEKHILEKRNRLSIVSSSLIIPYLNEQEHFDEIDMYIDGSIFSQDKRTVIRGLKGYTEEINIQGIKNNKKKLKKGKINETYTQPFIIGLADLMANNLFRRHTLEELAEHPKKVEFNSKL
jgi:hypothetical protein